MASEVWECWRCKTSYKSCMPLVEVTCRKGHAMKKVKEEPTTKESLHAAAASV